MKFTILLCSLSLFIACNTQNGQKELPKHFKDIDLKTMSGIGEAKATDYPRVEISDSFGVRTIRIFADSETCVSRKYIYSNGEWITRYSTVDDTAVIYTKRIIKDGRFVEFSYTDTLKNRVFDIGILYGDSLVYYNPETAFYLEPSIEKLEFVRSNWKSKTKYLLESTKHHTKLIKEFNVNNSEISDKSVKCYSKLDRSFLWWIEMMSHLSSSNCDSASD